MSLEELNKKMASTDLGGDEMTVALSIYHNGTTWSLYKYIESASEKDREAIIEEITSIASRLSVGLAGAFQTSKDRKNTENEHN